MSMIDVVAAHALIADGSGALVVDVRAPGEFETARIPGAINAPLDQIDGQLTWPPILLIAIRARANRCRRPLAVPAAPLSIAASSAWLASGCPVIRGRPRWALERQVRLTAALLVAAAVAVSLWWPPARYLAGLIGAGLAVAAVTNTCAWGCCSAGCPATGASAANRTAIIPHGHGRSSG